MDCDTKSTVPVYLISPRGIESLFLSSTIPDREKQICSVLQAERLELRSKDLCFGGMDVWSVVAYYNLDKNIPICGNTLCTNQVCVDNSQEPDYNVFGSQLLKSIILGGVAGNVVVEIYKSNQGFPEYLPRDVNPIPDLACYETIPASINEIRMNDDNKKMWGWTNGLTLSQIETCMFAKDGNLKVLSADIMQIVYKTSFIDDARGVTIILEAWKENIAAYRDRCEFCGDIVITTPFFTSYCTTQCKMCAVCVKNRHFTAHQMKCPCESSSWIATRSWNCGLEIF